MDTSNKPQFSDDYFRSFGIEWKSESIFRRIRSLLTNHGLFYLYAYRKIQRNDAPLLFFRVLKRNLKLRYGLEIDSPSVGKGLYLGHPYNITVSEYAVIGDNCNLSKGVTIGITPHGEHAGAPTLGNRVWVGTNAVIVGKISIGDNVLIAPNAFVNRDVPPNSVVIGNPAVIHTDRPDATEGYIQNVR